MDEYSHIASEDEYDEDTRSLDNNEDEKEVKSTFHTDYDEEIQEVKDKQGLSPRGRKITRHNLHSENINKPITRSRSRGL